jgi:hypothetical protein
MAGWNLRTSRTHMPAASAIRPAAIPRQSWTADRLARFLVGIASGTCLGAGWLLPEYQAVAWTTIAVMALQLVITSLVGWCPFHEAIKRLGIPDREEVYARLQEKESDQGNRFDRPLIGRLP